jgi:hypothetical protein
MRVDLHVVKEVADEVVLVLVVGGHIVVSPLSVPSLEREVAGVMYPALHKRGRKRDEGLARDLGEADSEARVRKYAAVFRTVPGAPLGFRSVVEEMIRVVRSSQNVERVLADDDMLIRKILSVLALRWNRPPQLDPPGGTGSPPSRTGPAGGLPAEVRAWEVRRGETPPEPDPERQERSRNRKPRRLD